MPVRTPPPPTGPLINYLSYFVIACVFAWAFEDDIKAKIHHFAPGLNLDMPPRVRKIVVTMLAAVSAALLGYMFWWTSKYTI